MDKTLDFSNKLEDIRCELEHYMYLAKLKDLDEKLWNILEVTINLKETILKIENINTKEIKTLVIKAKTENP